MNNVQNSVRSSHTLQTPASYTTRLGRGCAEMARYAGVGILFLALLPAGAAQAAAPGARFAEGRILVQPRVGLPAAQFSQLLDQAGGRAAGTIRGLNVHIVEVTPQSEVAVARALSRKRNIQFAEPDELVELSETVPDDPKYGSAWHLQTIGAPMAWDTASGSGVTVAVLDTGVDSYHLDLLSNVVAGWNSASGSPDTTDVSGHGTKVAGVVAAETNNTLGVASVAGQARILPVRVTDRSDGWA